VRALSGTHTMNEVTGELSLGATGWVIRGGALAEPVEGDDGLLLQRRQEHFQERLERLWKSADIQRNEQRLEQSG